MPSTKTQVRVLLDDATAHEVNQIAKRESRPVASLCAILINQALYQRRSAEKQTSALVQMIRGSAEGF
jgi:hypothetical protein